METADLIEIPHDDFSYNISIHNHNSVFKWIQKEGMLSKIALNAHVIGGEIWIIMELFYWLKNETFF